jgi:hypothetical protein
MTWVLRVGATNLTYGQIVALGGDFYGTPDQTPISDTGSVQSFTDAFNTLANANEQELNSILGILAKEQQAIADAVKAGKQPSAAFEALGDSLSFQWQTATNERYLKLAKRNLDHFWPDAQTAYKAGHLAARQAAASASTFDPGTAFDGLVRAYAMNAFADHFLSDMFSAGHLRTPRRALYNIQWLLPEESGIISRAMHNEDCKHGLQVDASPGGVRTSWTCYGDGQELDAVNKDNFAWATRALQASADEVWQSFGAHKAVNPTSPAALQFVPNNLGLPDATTPPIGGPNYAPMFWAPAVTGSTVVPVYRRGGGPKPIGWQNRNLSPWFLDPQWDAHTMAGDLLIYWLIDNVTPKVMELLAFLVTGVPWEKPAQVPELV